MPPVHVLQRIVLALIVVLALTQLLVVILR
jgi:hypothetical protein